MPESIFLNRKTPRLPILGLPILRLPILGLPILGLPILGLLWGCHLRLGLFLRLSGRGTLCWRQGLWPATLGHRAGLCAAGHRLYRRQFPRRALFGAVWDEPDGGGRNHGHDGGHGAFGAGDLGGAVGVGLSGPGVFFGSMVALGNGHGTALPNADAGMLSVRPELAGTASGLGGAAITIGGGAVLSALAVAALPPGSGELPLVGLMLVCSIASTLAILPLQTAVRRI